MKLTVEYINHSGYVVETPSVICVFDYVKGLLPRKYLDSSKPITFFVTHSHHDHYNQGIFAYKKNVILSDDITPPKGIDVIKCKQGDTIVSNGLKIMVFGSTDLGVSFYIDTGEVTVFFAGDLNDWHWKDESTKDEIDLANLQFLSIMEDLRPWKVDIAMFPIDARMHTDFDQGARTYTSMIQPKHLFPMHFTDVDSLVMFEKWQKQHVPQTQYHIPKSDNSVFDLEVL